MKLKYLVLVVALTGSIRAGTPKSNPDRYLQVVTTFIETMMQSGTDHYGPVHSPLFADMLDLKTLSLPVQEWPDKFQNRQERHF